MYYNLLSKHFIITIIRNIIMKKNLFYLIFATGSSLFLSGCFCNKKNCCPNNTAKNEIAINNEQTKEKITEEALNNNHNNTESTEEFSK